MNKRDFTIATPISLVLFTAIMGVVVIAVLIMPDPSGNTSAVARAVCYALALLIAAAVWRVAMQRVKVQDSVIKIRTAMGRSYQVTCSDIVKIECTKSISTKQGARFYITVSTDTHEFAVSARKTGFSTFAGYLLDKLATGAIPSAAASESCRKMLRRYQNDFQPKKKN